MKKHDRRTPVLSWALKLGFQCTRIKFSQGPCLSQETENPQQHLKVSCFPGTSPFAWCEWVTDWKCRPGSGTHQLQAALSQRRDSAAFMPARRSFSPHKCTLLAMSVGPWEVTVYSFGCCLSIHVSHNLSLTVRVTKAWKSRTLQRALELRLEDSLWTCDFLLPPLLGAKAEKPSWSS